MLGSTRPFRQTITNPTEKAIQTAHNTSVSIDPIASVIKREATSAVSRSRIFRFFTFAIMIITTFEHTSDLLTGTQSFFQTPFETMNQLFLSVSTTSALNLICGSMGSAVNSTLYFLGIMIGLTALQMLNNFIQFYTTNALTFLRIPAGLRSSISILITIGIYGLGIIYGLPAINAISAAAGAATSYALWYTFSIGAASIAALVGGIGLSYLFSKALNIPMPKQIQKISDVLRKKSRQIVNAIHSEIKMPNYLFFWSALLWIGYSLHAIPSGLTTVLSVTLTIGLQAMILNIVYGANLAALNATRNALHRAAETLAFSWISIREFFRGNSHLRHISYLELLSLTTAIETFKDSPFIKARGQFDINNQEDLKEFICYLRDCDFTNELSILTKLGANPNECDYHAPEEWTAQNALFRTNTSEPTPVLVDKKTRISLQWQCARAMAQNKLSVEGATTRAQEIVQGYTTWQSEEEIRKQRLG